MNFDCARIQTALKNNEPIKLSEELTRHLSDCVACAALLEARQSVKATLQRAMANDAAAPAALRARIRRELSQPPTVWQSVLSWFGGLNNGWMLAAAAAALLVTIGGVSLVRKQQAVETSQFASLNHETAVTEHNARLLKIGFGNHRHCAVERDYSAGPRSFAQMAEALGGEWIELVALTTEHVPADYCVMIAHRCKFEGREFIHLILSNQQTLLSLVLTHKNGEAFDAQPAIAQIAGVTLHQMREQNYSVAGFETAAYLGYVVSGLEAEQNLQLALRLAPAVKEFVARRESRTRRCGTRWHLVPQH